MFHVLSSMFYNDVMSIVTDLHLHSKYSQAISQKMDLLVMRKKRKLPRKNPRASSKHYFRHQYSAVSSQLRRITDDRQLITVILLFLFIFLLPTQLGKHFFFEFSYLSGIRSDYLAPTLYVTDILVFLLAVVWRKDVAVFFRKRTVSRLLFLLLIPTVVSYFDPVSIYRYIKIVELLILFSVFRKVKNTISIWYALLAGTTVQVILATWQFIMKSSVGGLWYFLGERAITLSTPDIAKTAIQGVEFLRSYGTFSHPNSMAGFYLLIYAFVLFNPRIRGYYLKNVLLLFSTILVFLSFSKIAIIGFFLINLRYLLKQHVRGDDTCTFCLIARALGGLAIAAIVFAAHGDPLSLSKRITLADNALWLFTHHAFTGIGWGQYVKLQHLQISSMFLQPVHNVFLLLITEAGVLVGGTILYCIARYIWRHRRHSLFVSCAAVVIFTGAFDHYWLTLQQNWLLLPVLLGLIESVDDFS